MSNLQKPMNVKGNINRDKRPRTGSVYPNVSNKTRKPSTVDPTRSLNPRSRQVKLPHTRSTHHHTHRSVGKNFLKTVRKDTKQPNRKVPVYYRRSTSPDPQPQVFPNKKCMTEEMIDNYIMKNEKLIKVHSALPSGKDDHPNKNKSKDLSTKTSLQNRKKSSLGDSKKITNCAPKMSATVSSKPIYHQRIVKPDSNTFSESVIKSRKEKSMPPLHIRSEKPRTLNERRLTVFDTQPISNQSSKKTTNDSVTKFTTARYKRLPTINEKAVIRPTGNKNQFNDAPSNYADPKLLGVCGKCIKYCMIISNIIILIGGVTVLVIACWTLHDNSFLVNLIGANLYTNMIYTLIATSSVLILISILGCFGAAREVRCILVSYFIILCILFVSIMVGGLGSYLFHDELYNSMEKNMKSSLEDYWDRKSTRQAWDIAQRNLQCCGVNSVDDWPKNKVPKTCCPKSNKEMKCEKEASFEPGCLDEGHIYLLKHSSSIALAYVMLIFIIVLGMVLSCALCRMIQDRKQNSDN